MSFLQMSLHGAVMIAVITILRALTLNQVPKKTFLVLWALALVRLLVPFSLPSRLSVYTLLARQAPAVSDATAVSPPPVLPAAPVTITPQVTAPSASTVLPWAVVWLVGIEVCALTFAVLYVRCYREFQTSLPVEHDYARRWLAAHPLRRKLVIRQSDRVSSPLTFGVLRPVILMPKSTDWSDEGTLRFVLEHEFVHVQRFDALSKLALIAAVCVHWFDPLVWVMYVLANRDLELSCDETVVHRFGSARADYARTLIRMMETRSGVAPLCNGFSKNAIEERITAIMKTKKTTIVMLVASAIVIIGVTGTFATSANASDKIDNKNSEYIESTIAEDVMLAYNDEDGNIYYSADGGETFFNEKEFNEKYPSPEVEWWTYEEYKEWLDNERIQLQSMLGEKAWTGGRGEFVWTQEMIDETIASYEEILQKIENGVKVSKTVDGSGEIQIATYDDKEHFMESVEGVAIASDKETKVFGPYDTKEELLDAIKPYCEEQVRLGNMTQQEADEIIEKYE